MPENKQKNTTNQDRAPEKKQRRDDSNTNFPRVPNPESDKNKMLQQNDIE